MVVVGLRVIGATEGHILGSMSHKVTSISDIPVLEV
ncbi:hypothetical protein [Celeribacter sp.]